MPRGRSFASWQPDLSSLGRGSKQTQEGEGDVIHAPRPQRVVKTHPLPLPLPTPCKSKGPPRKICDRLRSEGKVLCALGITCSAAATRHIPLYPSTAFSSRKPVCTAFVERRLRFTLQNLLLLSTSFCKTVMDAVRVNAYDNIFISHTIDHINVLYWSIRNGLHLCSSTLLSH